MVVTPDIVKLLSDPDAMAAAVRLRADLDRDGAALREERETFERDKATGLAELAERSASVAAQLAELTAQREAVEAIHERNVAFAREVKSWTFP